jgi:colanic acid biosynthesis glycosyl transferase WcaI
MRILIVSAYFAPELAGNAPYVTGVADHYASSGHEVTVLTGFPHYPDWRALRQRKPVVVERHASARIVRRAHLIPTSSGMAARAFYEASLIATAVPLLGTVVRRPDAIVAFSPALADGLVANVASRTFRRPYGVVFQDLFGKGADELLGAEGRLRPARFLRAIELHVAANARAVGYVTEGFAPYLQGAAGHRLMRLQNWSQLAEATCTPSATRARYGWTDRGVVVHAGNMGSKQGLEVVLEAASLLPSVQFVLAGDGHQRPYLEQLAATMRLENVTFLGGLSDAIHANLLAAADALLLVQRSTVREMSLPSKVQTYLAAHRPIIASVALDSEAGRVLAGNESAALVEPGNARALADAIANSVAGSARTILNDTVARAEALRGYDRLLNRISAAPMASSEKRARPSLRRVP